MQSKTRDLWIVAAVTAAAATILELRERYTAGHSRTVRDYALLLAGEMGLRDQILAHHERYDGAGYPRGLAGAAIPLAARIFTVADAFDALTTDRPYHDALSWPEAASKVVDGRGSQFDPDVADAFLRVPFQAWARVAAITGVTLRHGAAVVQPPATSGGASGGGGAFAVASATGGA